MEIVSTEEYWQLILNDLSKVGQITTEDEEFNKIATYTWSVLQNTFVISDDENYIKSFEEMVDVDNEGLSIIERKANVLFLLSKKKYVPRNLIKKGLERLGIDRCEIEYDRENNKVTIITDDLDEDKLTMVTSFVNNLVSENIEKEIYFGFIPAGYKRVEYLDCERNIVQYIETPVYLDKDCELYVELLFEEKITFSRTDRLNGSGLLEQSQAWTYPDMGTWWGDVSPFNAISIIAEVKLGDKCVIKNSALGLYINDVFHRRENPSSGSALTKATFFAKIMTETGYKGARIYECAITRAGEDLFRGLPCLDSTGAPCIFDKVSKKTFYNQGSGDFLYPTESTTYSFRRRVLPDWGKLTENGLRRLYHAPDDYEGELIEYALENNYKRIIETEKPEEGYWTPQWKETEEEIVLEWIETEEPTTEQ